LLPLLQRSVLIAFCLNFIGVFGSYTIPYLLGPAAPQMMGVSMQQAYSQFQDRIGAETQAVITFLCCALIGFLYVRTVTRQRANERT
jgi:ABC-type spermidine/putrescine transport system permease subunit I